MIYHRVRIQWSYKQRGEANMTQTQKALLKKADALKRLGKAGNAKQLADKLQQTLQTRTR